MQEELGVEPAAETRDLHRQILSDKLVPRPDSQMIPADAPTVSHLPAQPTSFIGRAEELGRPMLYGTTKTFLEVFGLANLKDLPKVEEFKGKAPSA